MFCMRTYTINVQRYKKIRNNQVFQPKYVVEYIKVASPHQYIPQSLDIPKKSCTFVAILGKYGLFKTKQPKILSL